jgi:hypothetical protein
VSGGGNRSSLFLDVVRVGQNDIRQSGGLGQRQAVRGTRSVPGKAGLKGAPWARGVPGGPLDLQTRLNNPRDDSYRASTRRSLMLRAARHKDRGASSQAGDDATAG